MKAPLPKIGTIFRTIRSVRKFSTKIWILDFGAKFVNPLWPTLDKKWWYVYIHIAMRSSGDYLVIRISPYMHFLLHPKLRYPGILWPLRLQTVRVQNFKARVNVLQCYFIIFLQRLLFMERSWINYGTSSNIIMSNLRLRHTSAKHFQTSNR